VLACQARPKSDLVLQIATTSAVAKTQAGTYTGTLTRLDRLSPTTVALTIETPDRDRLAFLPGQYVNIQVPGTDQSRSYSFSNGPDDKSLTFLVKLTPGGVMTGYLTEWASVGDELTFTGPNGSFFLRETERPVLLLAGGTGLAPILSILHKLRDEGTDRPVHLVYGVSSDDDLVEVETIEAFADEIDSLTWDYCVADPASGAPNKGYVMSLIRPEHLHDGDVAVYLCGPPPMVEAVRTHFADEGVEPTGFYYEKFALSGSGQADEAVTETAAAPAEAPRDETAQAPLEQPVASEPLTAATTASRAEETAIARAVVGQRMSRPVGDGPVLPLDPGDSLLEERDARGVVGQGMLPRRDDRAMADAKARALPAFVTPGRFDGTVVVVTGAAQGIGERTARRISAEGGSVVLADRAEPVTHLAGELAGSGREALPVTCDLERWDGAEALVSQALQRFGRIDVLVNNVGGAINFKPFTQFTDAEIRAEIDRSLMTTLYACRAALPSMVERGRGVIVNVSSAATRGIHRIPYSAAKGGINAITASLAFEYADTGIRVVATAPGGTEAPARRVSRGTPEPRTEQERAWFQAHIDQTLETSLMRRYGTLDEQAAAICFLASDEASYITGTTLPVAGGDLG
jgi:NAD(P)-dependent dehydrogenase (short-subunit alcohol dehydrogenase family)/NAD(P)H-flavin reductase